MERIVYLLGAGFSAPMGLPVMSNFIFKAKDMYFNHLEDYSYFKDVFDTINNTSVIKNYFKADLFNIEEILSVLEMNDFIRGTNNGDLFKNFIADVIKYYTPEIKPYPDVVGNWNDFVFGTSDLWTKYGAFVASLLNLGFFQHRSKDYNPFNTGDYDEIVCSVLDNNVCYSVVSFNYDMLMEIPINYIKNNPVPFQKKKYKAENNIEFKNSLEDNAVEDFYIAKLHGSIDKMNIVPPTWNKYSNNDLLKTWKLAHKLITEANHIRILGYSLPITDSYIKYFLKSSILQSEHLKKIDVICYDPQGNVEAQYNDFIDFKYFRFKNGDIFSYLEKNAKAARDTFRNSNQYKGISFNQLERIHSEFMDSTGI